MAIKTIGQVLKERRTELGLGLSEAEKLTQIQKLYIVALETNDYKVLPGEFYTKAYLKQYAEKLNLDAEKILAAYEEGKGITVEDKDDIQESYHFVKPSDRVEPEEEFSKTWKHYIPVISLSVVALAIIGAVSAAVLLNKPETPDLLNNNYSISEQTKDSSVTSKPSSSSSTTTSSSVTTDKLSVIGSGNELNVKLSNAKTPVKIVFTVKSGGNAWVYASNTDMAATGITINDAKPSATAVMADGMSESMITLGNRDLVTLSINGKTVDLTSLAVNGPYNIKLTTDLTNGELPANNAGTTTANDGTVPPAQ